MIARLLSRLKENLRLCDRTLFMLVMLMMFAGIVFVYSASYQAGYYYHNDPYYFTVRQALWAIPSCLVFLIFLAIDYRSLQKAVKPLMAITLVLLLAVFVPFIGHESGGARRWIDFRLFTFNPSELAKLTIVIYLAFIFTKKRQKLEKSFTFGFLPPFLLVTLIFFIILMQSGFSTAALLLTVALVLFFAGGASMSHLAGIAVASVPVLTFFVLKFNYRKSRILSFLNPWEDSSGRGYHLIQALKAFAIGGATGTGLGNSVQKMGPLPTPHTDFIFAVIGEETGLVGLILVVAAFLLFFVRGVIIARRSSDGFGQLLAFGITILVTLHALLNMGIAVGMFPPTGVSLPFVSYGGSSMLVMAAACGILLNVSAQSTAESAPMHREIRDMVGDTVTEHPKGD
jgi:cell division protein FtsW